MFALIGSADPPDGRKAPIDTGRLGTICDASREWRLAAIACVVEGGHAMDKRHTGHCACGAVTYGFDTEPAFMANCHCTDCKRASGGEMATFVAVPRAQVERSAAARFELRT